jgi:short-subunit dehydrogenase
MQIAGKVFVVTGASSGIGLATSKALSARGGKVALLARSADVLKELAAEMADSLPVVVDVTDFPALRSAITRVNAHYGRIDGLINNAGRSYAAKVEEIEPEVFDEIFHLNVLAPIVAMQAVVPIMREQGEGSIVNINSGTAFMTIPTYSVYSASKRALAGFSRTAREELASSGIVVNQVYPDVTATNFGKNRMTAPQAQGPAADYSRGDSPELVAEFVLRAIEEGGGEYYVSERIEKLALAAR